MNMSLLVVKKINITYNFYRNFTCAHDHCPYVMRIKRHYDGKGLQEVEKGAVHRNHTDDIMKRAGLLEDVKMLLKEEFIERQQYCTVGSLVKDIKISQLENKWPHQLPVPSENQLHHFLLRGAKYGQLDLSTGRRSSPDKVCILISTTSTTK